MNLKTNINCSSGSAVGIVNRLRVEQLIRVIQFIFPARAEYSFFSSRFLDRHRGPTQTPIKYIPKAVFPRVKRGIEDDRSPKCRAELDKDCSY